MAKIDLTKTNITVLGLWNVAIISPQWIQNQFPDFKTENEIAIEVGLNSQDIRFEIKNLIINPSPNRLIMSPKSETEECINDLITLSSGIVKKLNHTPVFAVGSNFAYNLEMNEDIIPVKGETEKLNEYYKKIGKQFSGNFITQHVIVENDKQITIFYNFSPNEKIVSINYNLNTKKQDKMIEFIKEFSTQMNDAKNILNNIKEKIN